ncbi:uncharacterized protein VP01_3622g2 [Puccinia sorghi]|uniref:DUF4219 domain-containing protein n=1 Tax=Puccinia sorghi TaxID=27349 RepID=A0A0L6UUV3_9BASI|nr:uncharacterized protein VP01_3622g2 [Puccinia sorghi]
MAERTNKTSCKNIPLLNDTNFATWLVRIKVYLRSKKLLKESAFDSVVTPSNEEDPHALGNKIISQYASTSVNNKGRVWLNFMRYEYNGKLKTFITDISHLLNKITVIKLGVPDDHTFQVTRVGLPGRIS